MMETNAFVSRKKRRLLAGQQTEPMWARETWNNVGNMCYRDTNFTYPLSEDTGRQHFLSDTLRNAEDEGYEAGSKVNDGMVWDASAYYNPNTNWTGMRDRGKRFLLY